MSMTSCGARKTPEHSHLDQKVKGHYERVATDYNNLYKDHHEATMKVLDRIVNFSPEDRILDLGTGTGEITHRIWKQTPLKRPIVCVDPSKEMLKILKQCEGVSPVLSGAKEYFEGNPSPPPDGLYDKITLFHCLHHFKVEDLGPVFSGIKTHLSGNGTCIVLQYLNGLSVPFFEAIKQPVKYIKLDQLCGKILDDIGLKWKRSLESVHLPVETGPWYDAIRSRYLTYLEGLSDETLEEGIMLLKEKYEHKEIVELEFAFQVLFITK